MGRLELSSYLTLGFVGEGLFGQLLGCSGEGVQRQLNFYTGLGKWLRIQLNSLFAKDWVVICGAWLNSRVDPHSTRMTPAVQRLASAP
jgi:hypothetical protein